MQTQPTQPLSPESATPVGQLLEETYNRASADPSICVVDGYGIRIVVERGHLIVADGVGNHRRTRRYPKAGHGVRRLVLLGHTGTVSLEAVRWLDKTRIGFLHLDTDGRPLTTTAGYGLDDARLRRIQALATGTDTGLQIVARLLEGKLAGQAAVARDYLNAPDVAVTINELAETLPGAATTAEAMQLEAAAAAAYFNAWQNQVSITFARKHLPRVPDNWRTFTGRRSPLTSGYGAYKAADPINAILNYVYALGEAEARLACLTLGLDPGLGLLHADSRARDSLALDLLEPVRPNIDRYVLDLLAGHTFRRSDFHETDDGNVRVLPPLTHALAATLTTWAKAVAPWAELVAHRLADASERPLKKPTTLTSAKRRRNAKQSAQRGRPTTRQPTDAPSAPPPAGNVMVSRACVDCGNPVAHPQRRHCSQCWSGRRQAASLAGSQAAREALADAGGREARSRAISQGKLRAKTAAVAANGFSTQDWETLIQPTLQSMTLAQITAATGLSIASASGAKTGKRVPHPKHWPALLALTSAPAIPESEPRAAGLA